MTGQIDRFGSLEQMQRAQSFERTILRGIGEVMNGTKNMLELWCDVTASTRDQIDQEIERDLLHRYLVVCTEERSHSYRCLEFFE